MRRSSAAQGRRGGASGLQRRCKQIAQRIRAVAKSCLAPCGQREGMPRNLRDWAVQPPTERSAGQYVARQEAETIDALLFEQPLACLLVGSTQPLSNGNAESVLLPAGERRSETA